MIFFSRKNRPFELGPYPLERLAHDPSIIAREAAAPKSARPAPRDIPNANTFSKALEKYHVMYRQLGVVDPLPNKAPVPDDLALRTKDVKGAAYFLDAAQVGICEMNDNAWYDGSTALPHKYAMVIMVSHGRTPEADNLAHDWAKGHENATAEMRAFEIAVAVAEHIQYMGYNAKAHDHQTGDVDVNRLSVLAGLTIRDGEGLTNPYLGNEYAIAAVTTEYPINVDEPLAASAKNGKGLAYWLGIGGGVPGIEYGRRAKRATHLSAYPMEQVDRVERPTTLIIDDEVPQVPKRAEFFSRSEFGDLGEKSRVERGRFAFKHPFAQAMVSLIKRMVPEQDGEVIGTPDAKYSDPAENAKALKSLSYMLGSEITGICEIPRYAWYSHRKDGSEIPYNHKYAVVMLIDQGYETMEGASGDDYISGAQSMRAYMRGAEIAGVMAEHLRNNGFPSRPQTNADSDVIHTSLVMWAGLGELSRIGEVVLNPFIGPRLKTVVMTTDMPLEVDKPIDFGLQNFCSNCLKCARECPCDAISWGDKVMFNGYEMWKPDVERCTRYRLTNPKGLACGRCMKTCPLNKVVTWEGPLMTRVASWFGVNVRFMKPILVPIAVWADDWLGHGIRNPLKKWWLDLEIVDGHAIEPRKGVNERDLDLDHKIDPAEQKMAYYHASDMPPPNASEPVGVDRKAALKAKELLETPAEALARIAAGGAKPAHYTPTPPLETVGDGVDAEKVGIWDKK
ncbi:MAG: reductive dehalogenase domain-containing protein [Rhodospirillales bacterium]|jgi:ferredoxin